MLKVLAYDFNMPPIIFLMDVNNINHHGMAWTVSFSFSIHTSKSVIVTSLIICDVIDIPYIASNPSAR